MALMVSIMLAGSFYFILQFLREKRGKSAFADRLNGIRSAVDYKETLTRVLLKTVRQLAIFNIQIKLPRYKKYLEEQLSLAKAGFSVNEFMGIKELCLLAGLLLSFFIEAGVLFSFCVLAGGFFLPDLWLRERRAVYERELCSSLPFALDLITVCVEAGLSYDAAIIKYTQNSNENPVKKEFLQYLSDVKYGKTRKEALNSMASRAGVKEFSSFVSAIIQAIELGTGMAKTLRAQASGIRVVRSQKIEKLALQAPVKLLIPLVLFIFPVIFIMLFGPLLLRLLAMF
ncbi:MAG: type II secretion system F family protein [Candidatus Firestonebacteria bacterium]